MGNMLAGDLNACLANPRDQQYEQLENVLAGNGLLDQAQHFSPRCKYLVGGVCTWIMWREGRPILGQVDYILGTRDDFSMVGLWEPITPTGHQMVLGVLRGYGVTSHYAYVKVQTTWIIREDKERTR